MSVSTCQIVVGYDFRPSGTAALDRALELAERMPKHVLHVLCVIDPDLPPKDIIPLSGGVDFRYAEQVQDAMTAQIEQHLRTSERPGRVHFFVHARIGRPAQEILNLAVDVGADMIVVGSRDVHGVERLVLGSVSEKVVRDALCTVEVARAKGYPDVELEPIEPKPGAHHPYIPPHRYFYEDNRVNVRPREWPLY
jgi:nucleotide-binding universal stress UspA family protein